MSVTINFVINILRKKMFRIKTIDILTFFEIDISLIRMVLINGIRKYVKKNYVDLMYEMQ